MISLFLRKYLRFTYQLLWSEQDQPAFAAFHIYFTADECLPFIINKQNEHPYFFKPDKITKQTIYLISFNPRLITANNLHDDIRPYHYEQNIQDQQNLFTNNDNYDEDDNNNEEYMFENQNENRNEDMTPNINENNASEYTTPESTTLAQNASQTGTSATTQFVRIPTRIVDAAQNTHDPQSYSDTSPHRNITFNLPPSPDEVVQDGTQNVSSIRDTSVNVSSPTRTISNGIQSITRSVYDPPSVPSVFKHPNRTMQPENNHNNNQQTSSHHYDPFNYFFFPPPNTNIPTNIYQNVPQSNNNTNLVTQHTFTHFLQTKSSQSNFLSQNQRTSLSNIVQSPQRRSQNPPLSHISIDPMYQMNQHTTYNPTTTSPP